MLWTTGYFELSGAFDPDEITRQLRVEPTWIQRIGDPGPSGSLGPRKGAEWCLSCDSVGVVDASIQTIDVDDQIITLISKLNTKRDLVAELSRTYEGTFHIHQLLSIHHIGFFLTPQILRELAGLNVFLDCKYFDIPTALTSEVTLAD